MDNNPIDDRHIRVFISSTFQDMEKEREQLIKKVFPMLRKKAAKRGVVVTELDLRWGVTQEESENGKVLEICLNEIDNSRPFFIGLLGDRYGWCPSEHELDKNHNIEELFPWVRQAIEEGKSVTEMEFLYGALSPQLFQDKHIDAYFWIKKNAANDDERLEKLKTEVRENLNYPCAEYTSPSDLGNQVAAIFEKILDERYPQQQLSEVESFRLEQELYQSRLTRTFLPIEQNIKVLDSFLQDDEKNVIALVGEHGSGKSATIANWTTWLKDKPDYHCITCFIQALNSESDLIYVLGYLNAELKELLGYDTSSDLLKEGDEPDKIFKQLFQEAQKSVNLLLILDGINVLDEQEDKFLDWLPDVFCGSKIILTTTEEDSTYQSVVRKGYGVANISIMDDGKAKEQYIDLFLGQYGKSLSVEQKDKLALSAITSNPGILHTILVELKNNSNYEDLDQAIDILTSAANIDGVYRFILDNAEKTFGKEFVIRTLLSIAVSRNGLDEKTLMAITEATPLHWSHFFCALSEHLYSHQGLVSFSNSKFKSVIIDTYGQIADTVRRQIIHYYIGDDIVRECAYQWFQLNELKELNRILSRGEVLGILYSTDSRNLYRYWKTIQAAHLPKIRHYLNFSKAGFWVNIEKGRFLQTVSEWRLSSYFLIREIVKNRIRKIFRKHDDENLIICQAVALDLLCNNMLQMGLLKSCKYFATKLLCYVSSNSTMQMYDIFRQDAEIAIADVNSLLGGKCDAETAFDTLLQTDEKNEGEYVDLLARTELLLNALWTYLHTNKEKAIKCFYETEKLFEKIIKTHPQYGYERYLYLLQYAPSLFANDIQKQYLNRALEIVDMAESEGIAIQDFIMAKLYSQFANTIAVENITMAAQYCDIAMDICSTLSEKKDVCAEVFCISAQIYLYAGENEKAQIIVQKFIDLSPELPDKKKNSVLWATIYYCQGVLDFTSNPESSERLFGKSISEFDKAGDYANNNLFFGYANDDLGRLLYAKGEYKAAIKRMRTAIKIYDNIISQNNDVELLCQIIESYNNIGYACMYIGSINAAKLEIIDNLSRLDQIPMEHPQHYRSKVNTYTAMADVLSKEGNNSAAKPYYIKALDAAQKGNINDDIVERLEQCLSQL